MTLTLRGVNVDRLVETALDRTPVSGLTHEFYKYPARFSPSFARAAIDEFTDPGEIVLDPFVGGGTTLVEAAAAGRRAIGVDVNSLAVFVSRAKTNPLTCNDKSKLLGWIEYLSPRLNLHRKVPSKSSWRESGYHRNIDGKQTWPIRKLIELALIELSELENERQRLFARCVLLRTGQWALDCRQTFVSAEKFRSQLWIYFHEMLDGIQDYRSAALAANHTKSGGKILVPKCQQMPASRIDKISLFRRNEAPRLVLTSPPYPGVHILYHRWQVGGRKETPAPYWIAGCIDGHSASRYTFGNRNSHDTGTYYDCLRESFSTISKVCNRESIVIQVVGFSNPKTQMSRYLKAITESGFTELRLGRKLNTSDGRLWRRVPNRKWYAEREGRIATQQEVVLFHKLR